MQMLMLAEEEAKHRGYLLMQATTVKSNVAVIKLNEKFGFVKVNEILNPRTGHTLYVWQKPTKTGGKNEGAVESKKGQR